MGDDTDTASASFESWLNRNIQDVSEAIRRGTDRGLYAWCADKPITTESAIEEGAKAAVKAWMDENPAVVGSAIEKAVRGYLDDNGMPESER